MLKYLHVVSQSINFILFEMQGLSEASEKYGVLGVKTSTIVAAQKRAALFSCKGYELQEVVYQSRMSFKSFFKWLQGRKLYFFVECMNNPNANILQAPWSRWTTL